MGEAWFHGHDDERPWTGPFSSREAAIQDGHDTYDDSEDGFCIATGRKPTAEELIPSLDWIIESMGENAYDLVGDAAEDWPDVGAEGKKELGKALAEWAKKYCPVNFWAINGKHEDIECRKTSES